MLRGCLSHCWRRTSIVTFGGWRNRRARFSTSARVMEPRLSFSPADHSLFDQPLAISVEGLRPEQEIGLRASLEDEKGERFESHAFYRADGEGRLDLQRSPALEGGTFSGLEPMGLLWSLQPLKPLRRLVKRDVERPFLLELEVLERLGATLPGRVLAKGSHERRFLADGVKRLPVREGSIRATLFQPPGKGPFPGIIRIPGTGVGIPESSACLLANHGFAVLALPYYGYEDLPKDIRELHLEYFEEAVNYMLKHPVVKGPEIGVLGHSKGGDICLSMASFLKGITAIVTVNGCIANAGVAVRYKDITIPPVGFNINRIKIDQNGFYDIIDVLNNPLKGADRQSLIPLEKAEGRFLFIVGMDDHIWKSEFFANEAAKHLQARGKDKPGIICYPEAGHYIEPPYTPLCPASVHLFVGKRVVWGGQPRAHAAAQVDAWKQIQNFFHQILNGSKNKL
ncbi:acyl-coenzyme A thioesterase 1-like [Thamnophis elegans]|uniref:acyl-coenzyme A thioesterase 1-like n=1 Tax=Thamnophis elegans TaxID=35005 RepID=UPI001376DC5E|nr:acyl-coenzyme A thioesterase 1-like [Thamnophis elegans]